MIWAAFLSRHAEGRPRKLTKNRRFGLIDLEVPFRSKGWVCLQAPERLCLMGGNHPR